MQGTFDDDDLVCLFCRTPNSRDTRICLNCDRSLVVGKLVSCGAGIMPKGFVWEMPPTRLTMGRNLSCDFVLPSPMVAEVQLSFDYHPNAATFNIDNLQPQVPCLLNGKQLHELTRLQEGDELRIGADAFTFHPAQVSETKVAAADEALTTQLQLTLSIISKFHGSMNLQNVYDSALEAVLRITRTKRGYVFIVEEEDDGGTTLATVSVHLAGGKAEKDLRAHTIAESVIRNALAGEPSILIEDANAGDPTQPNQSWRRIKLKTVICLPLITFDVQTGQKQVLGVIYADSFMPTGRLPDHCRSTLEMLTQIVAGNVLKWRRINRQASIVREVQMQVDVVESHLHLLESLISEPELMREFELLDEMVQAIRRQVGRTSTIAV